jgi:hypothetical protein
MPSVTPIADKLHKQIEDRYIEIDRDKLTRWLMARSAQRDLGIIDCRGKPISVGLGCVFEGQLRALFWAMPKPCIEDMVQACCDELGTVFKDYTAQQRADTVEYLTASLQGFANRIYGRMVDLDRRMRGNGYPDSVQPYDPAKEIAEAHKVIDFKLSVIANHYGDADSQVQPKLTEAWDGNVRLPFVTINLAKALTWLRSTKAWATISRPK